MKKKRKYIYLCVFGILLLVLVFTVYVYNSFIIVSVGHNDKFTKERVGIIDTYLSKEHDNIVYGGYSGKIDEEANTHGDMVVSFLDDIGYQDTIYYYSAWNGTKTDTEGIISGLEWMLKNGVNRVSISLSSKKYSKELSDWVKTHNELTIYSSYNNKLNTVADYPAMYEGIIGIGSDGRIPFKDSDIKYRTSKMLLIKNGRFKSYYGNSFLTPYTMLIMKDKNK